MAQGPRHCAHCGAVVARRQTRFCEFCGTELDRVAGAPSGAAHSPFGDVVGRFEALKRSPELAALLAREPSTPRLPGGLALRLVMTLPFVVGAFVVLQGFRVVGGPLVLLPLSMVGVGLVFMVIQARAGLAWQRAPLQPVLALVIGQRSEHGPGEGHGRTRHHVSLEDVDGARRDLAALGPVVGCTVPGDMGVAWTKGDHLVAFERVPV